MIPSQLSTTLVRALDLGFLFPLIPYQFPYVIAVVKLFGTPSKTSVIVPGGTNQAQWQSLTVSSANEGCCDGVGLEVALLHFIRTDSVFHLD